MALAIRLGMTSKYLKVIKMALEGAQKSYRERVEAIADHARKVMLPYFSKHRLTYTAGNGTWFISRERADQRLVMDSDLPKHIFELLYLEVERSFPLGFYIADIKQEDWLP
jgi:hypothetical protein